jgi:YidC/Oxa1 family membrane protein insertase
LLKLLPFFIGYISLTVPAGLALYWFWNNVFTTGIQVFLRNGGARATVEAPEDVAIKVPLGCVYIPEGTEILPEDYKYEGPSVIWDEEWLAKWQEDQVANVGEIAADYAIASGMSEEDAKAMEQQIRSRIPRKKEISERKLATETELKAIIKDYKARGEDASVFERGLEALRAYKAELKQADSQKNGEVLAAAKEG